MNKKIFGPPSVIAKYCVVFAAITVFVGGFLIVDSTFAAGPATVNLGTAGNFAILSKAGISTTGTTLITGNIGVSPIASTAITGFGLTLDRYGQFSKSALVTGGNVYAANYAVPTPSALTTAILNMQTAYADAAGRKNPTATELGAGNIGGKTIAPGLYKWSSNVTIPTDVTLSGGANDVWIFQIAGILDISSGKKVILSGGAQAKNIFWQVAGKTTIGTTAVFNGNILSKTAIVLKTGAKLSGRALAQTAVTLDANSAIVPSATAPSIATPLPTTQAPTTKTPATTTTKIATTTKTVVIPPVGPSSTLGQQVRAITANLGKGSVGNNVTILQKFLISQNKGPAAKALAKIGTTTYFGASTISALVEFQVKVGIKPATGNFGAITRAYLKANN